MLIGIKKMTKSTDVKNFTRGGQITLHNIRMFFQIMDKVTWISAAVFLAVTLSIGWNVTTAYERYIFDEYLWSATMPMLNPTAATQFIQPNGSVMTVKYSDINEAPLVKEIIRTTCIKLIRSILGGLLCGIIVFCGISYWLKKRGASQTEDIPVKGDSILSKDATRDLIKKQGMNSDLILAGLPLIKDKETSHLLFHGTVGSGKSTAIKELLDQIRLRGDRAIIYDKGCNFLEEFYQPNHDVLLNPMDTRGESWHLWQECRDSADYDNLAAAQIPMPLSTADPFWVNAARTIFSAAAFEMRNDPDRSVVKLLRYLLTADLDLLQKYLKGTVAETLVSDKIEKTAISIKSVLATYLKSMKYIKDDDSPFSIRQWIQNESGNNWLFITSLGDRHETLKPLITAWLDIAVNTLLSLPPKFDRRIWLILDELTSLQQLPYLTQTLSESRKFGGCAIVGLQNYAQLAKLYGQDGAREISSLINTRAMFRQPDPEIAKWSAQNFGETITDEIREGISYGANTMRDGVSINRVETRKPVVSYSEIMSLGDLHAYIRLPGKFPITAIDFNYKHRDKKNNGFILRHFDETKMNEIDQIIETCEKPPTILSTEKKRKSAIPKNKKNEEQGSIDVYAMDV
jgi:type IV conjugative transfer system coupling protein TraD